MMTLRCTAALLKTWKLAGNPRPSGSDALTGDWFGNVFKLGRRKYFIFVSAKTLVPVVTRTASRFPLPEFVPALYQALLEVGIPEPVIQAEFERLSPITVAATNNRRVLGSMNDMVRCLEALFAARGAGFDPTSPEALRLLRETPMSLLGMATPADAVRSALGVEGAAAVSRSPAKPARTRAAKPNPPVGGDSRFAVRALLQQADAEDRPFAAIYRSLAEASRDPGADLAWFVVHERDEPVLIAAAAMLFEGAGGDILPPAARRRLRGGAVPVLRDALRDDGVPDGRKTFIGPLLERMGVDLDPAEYLGGFKDFDGAVTEMLGGVQGLEARPEVVAALLQGAGPLLDTEAPTLPGDAAWTQAASILAPLLKANPDLGGMMLGTMGAAAVFHGAEDNEALARAVRDAARTGSPAVLWQLRQLADWPFAGTLGMVAGKEAERLAARGAQARPGFSPTFQEGRVSSNDGSGGRQFGLFFDGEDGGLDAALFLCKDTWGLKDAIACFGDTSDVEGLFRHSPPEVSVVPCTLALGRALFGDAAAVSLETGKRLPPMAFLCRQYLGEASIPHVRRRPDLSAYDRDMNTGSPANVADSAKLAESPLYGGLWFASNAVYDFMRTHGGGKPLSFDEFKRFIRTVCSGEKDDLVRRMGVILEVEALTGRAGRKPNRSAARVLAALTAGAFENIPYVRELAACSALYVGENVARGHRSQGEINEATLARDEEIQRHLFDGDLDLEDR